MQKNPSATEAPRVMTAARIDHCLTRVMYAKSDACRRRRALKAKIHARGQKDLRSYIYLEKAFRAARALRLNTVNNQLLFNDSLL